MHKKPLSYYFVKGEALKRVYDTSAMGTGLVNSFLVISHLSVFAFGLYQLILAFVSILDGLSVKNIDGPITTEMRHHFKNGEKEKAKKIFKEIALWRIGYGIVVGAGIFAGAGIIADWYGNDIGLLIKIVSPLLLLYALQAIEGIFLKSVISFAHWSFPAIREGTKLFIFIGLLLFSQLTIMSVVAAHVIGIATGVVVIGFVSFIKKYIATLARVSTHPHSLLLVFFKTHGKFIFLRFGLARITKNTMPWLIKVFINTEAVAFYALAVNAVAFIEGFMPLAGITPLFLLKLGKDIELNFLFKNAAKYVVWIGSLFLVIGFFLAPWLLVLIFPNYAPAMPVFKIMIFALPIFGLYKILKAMLSVLREYKILAMRVLNEVAVLGIGSVILLPVLGVAGAGIVYVITFVERVWFFYSQLVKRYPDFKIKPKHLFKFDRSDLQLIRKVFTQSFSLLASFMRR